LFYIFNILPNSYNIKEIKKKY